MLFEIRLQTAELLILLRADLAGRDLRPQLDDARQIFHCDGGLRLLRKRCDLLVKLDLAAAQLRHARVVLLCLFRVLGQHTELQLNVRALLAQLHEPPERLVVQVHIRTRLVDQVDGLIRQEAVGDVAF